MTKRVKRILITICSFVFMLCLGIYAVAFGGTKKTVQANAASEPTVTFDSIDATQNNNDWSGQSSWKAVYVNFTGGTLEGDNYGTVPDGVSYTATGTQPTAFYVWRSGNQLQFLFQEFSALADGSTLTIAEGTELYGQTFPEVNLKVENGVWVYVEPTPDPEPTTATFMGVDANQNNVQWGTGEFIGVFLNFSEDFTAHSDLVSTITYTPAGGTETPFDFTWANFGGLGSANQLQLLINGLTPIADGAVLHIPEGTVVGGLLLPEVTLYMRNGNWHKEPLAEFKGITVNVTNDGNGRAVLALEFDQPMNASGVKTNLDPATVSTNTYNITLNGNTVGVKNAEGCILPRNRAYSTTTSDNVLELYFIGYGTAGTQFATDVTSPFANGTKLEIKDSVVNGYALQDVTLYFNATTEQWQATEPEENTETEVTTANFVGILNQVMDGSIWSAHSIIYINFDTELSTTSVDKTNDNLSGYLTINGNTVDYVGYYLKTLYANGTALELLLKNKTASDFAHGDVLKIEAGTPVGDVQLSEVVLYFNATMNQWQEAEISSVTYEKIEWNNDYGGANVLLLKYASADGDIYAISDAVVDLTTTVGELITINGTKISEMEGRKIESRPDYGAPFLLIQYDLTYATHGAVLTIPADTVAGNAILPALTLYMNSETKQWQTTEPEPLEEPKANYVGVFGSDMSGTVWNAHSLLQIEFDRALAPNTTDIQGAETPANNSGNLSSQLTLGGQHVTMGSQVNFYLNAFAYATTEGGNVNSAVLEILFIGKKASDFAHATKLYIPDGTLFGEVQLSEVTLYFNAGTSEWQKEKPAPLVSGFTAEVGAAIRIDKENGGLRFETHIEKSMYESLVETYGKGNIQMGTYILPEAWLSLSGKTLEEYIKAYGNNADYCMNISTWNTDKGDFGFANSNAAGEITDGNSYYKYYGTIAKVREENYAENFIGVGYLWITDQNGDEWLYLTHDGSWSRNVYEVAKAAYKDTENVKDNQLWGITSYFDKVIEVSTSDSEENTLVYDIDSVLEARSSYDYTKPTNYTVTVENGVITIESTSDKTITVIINGSTAGKVEANATAYADYYAVNAELFDTAEEAGAINYGIGEPTQELWGEDGISQWGTDNLNIYSTATNIANINAAFDGNTARIWIHTDDLCNPSTIDADDFFVDETLTALKAVIADFRSQGVTNISLMSGVSNLRSTKNYYNSTDKTWHTFWEILNKTATGDAYPGIVVLPYEDDYTDFLVLQQEYFRRLAIELGDSITAIEVLNEMEMSGSSYRYSIQNGYLPDINYVAQAAMDICKAATEGIKAAGKDIKIAMPSLACVSEVADNGNVTRYDTVKFVNAEYDYIATVKGNPDDYFQIINIHPYVFLSSSTSNTNYLYWEEGGTLTLQDSTTLAERWTTYIENLRSIFIKNGDAEKTIWITELGIADYKQCGSNSDIGKSSKWSDYRDNTLTRQTDAIQAIYNAIKSMPYIDTVIFFRVGDYACNDEHSYANCGEASYGIINADGTLKDFGKNLYTILTGSEDYTEIENAVASIK